MQGPGIVHLAREIGCTPVDNCLAKLLVKVISLEVFIPGY